MKETIRYEIIKYLETGAKWGGQVEDYLRGTSGTKGDTTARRLRELVREGKLLCEKRQVDGKGPKVNYYQIARPPSVTSKYAVEHIGSPHCLTLPLA